MNTDGMRSFAAESVFKMDIIHINLMENVC